MKIKILLGSLLSLSLLGGCASEKCEKTSKCEMSALGGKKRVNQATAKQAALAKVPGTVKKGGLEKYKGKDYWCFDIATKGAKKVTEVAVDPGTGQVVWTSADEEKHSHMR
jgi:uncharacterized membrane protein YkoI